MNTLSVVIITKNEESNIGRCIESIHDLASEVIVMDSGSTDKTSEIAGAFAKVKFINTEWLGYSATKNKGNALAQSDFVLSLDADETLDEEAQQSLALTLQRPMSSAAYSIPRLTNYCGKWIHHCGWRPDEQLRLFPRKLGEWNENQVHEKLQLKPGVEVKSLVGNILHYSYKSLKDHIHRINTYSSLGAEQVLERHRSLLILKGVLRGSMRFFKQYILKMGVLDGVEGFYICSITGFMVFLKYLKAHELLRLREKKAVL